MDGRQRHKRTFTEMSQSTLSPSPIFGDSGASNFYGRAGPSAPSNNFPSFFRQRSSHPHNNNHTPSQRASVEMAEASQSQRPRLEHRQSQTIIDLTDDVEEMPPLRTHPNRHQGPRPPHLGRSDAIRLQDLIDLTDREDSPELVIVSESAVQRPQQHVNRARPEPPRNHSPPLFVPNRPQPPQMNGVFASPYAAGYISGAANRLADMGGAGNAIRNFLGIHMLHHDNFQQQAMPGLMNYQHAAFADRKPDHIAPPAVPEGFTRSPKDEDIIICPSCEEELIHRKDDEEEEPTPKKGGKAPTRKEREEHPFWVVKECGHVYCNKCYQHRQQTAKTKHDSVHFGELEKTTGRRAKILTCNVEDCNSDVKSKDKWIGVFL